MKIIKVLSLLALNITDTHAKFVPPNFGGFVSSCTGGKKLAYVTFDSLIDTTKYALETRCIDPADCNSYVPTNGIYRNLDPTNDIEYQYLYAYC